VSTITPVAPPEPATAHGPTTAPTRPRAPRMSRANREVSATASLVFALLAVMLAFVALVTAAKAVSRANDANARAAKAGQGAAPAQPAKLAKVTLQEFSIALDTHIVQSGKVTLAVHNEGSITHELVIFRAASAAALPKVTKAGERSVGAVDEEVFPEKDKMGESGDVLVGKTVTKAFNLQPGTYIVFCNIDNAAKGQVTLNHFTHGMVATLVAV
jgi:hypothetical protein